MPSDRRRKPGILWPPRPPASRKLGTSAALLLKKDAELASSKNKSLHDVLRKRYARALELFRVG